MVVAPFNCIISLSFDDFIVGLRRRLHLVVQSIYGKSNCNI